MTGKIKISKAKVEQLPFCESGQAIFWDSSLLGFGVRIGAKRKSYIVQKKIAGKDVRFTLGIHGQLTAEKARKEAQKTLGEMSTGVNPMDEKRRAKAQSVKLGEAFELFLASRKNLKPKTVYNYEKVMNACFVSWLKKPVTKISKDMVERRHAQLGERNGHAYANLAMRTLRSVLNFVIGKYENSDGQPLILDNPVKRLSETRAWYKVNRRDDHIMPSQFPAFFDALDELESETMRDYLQFLLLSGLRREEGAQLKWENVDFDDKIFWISETKNDQKLTLPMSDYLEKLLSRRYKTAVNGYVFQGNGSKGHLVNPKRAVKHICKALGTHIMIHGLRRTFITIADSLDISAYAIKRLVNHSTSSDVTAGYIIYDVERLRKPMQQITGKMLSLAGRQGMGKVIPIQKEKAANRF